MKGMKGLRPPKMGPDSAGMGMPRFGSRAMRPGGMAKGGKVKKMADGGPPMTQSQMRQTMPPSPSRSQMPPGRGGQMQPPVRQAPGRPAPQGRPPMPMPPNRGDQMPMPPGRPQMNPGRPQMPPGPPGAMPPGRGGPSMPITQQPAGGGASPQVGNPMMQRSVPMKKGGKVHADEAMDKKLIRKEIARAEKAEDKGMKKGGMVKMARGGGVEVRGKTKGRFV